MDFTPGRDRLDLSGISDVAAFGDLDTSNDGMITAVDALASVTVDGLVLSFASTSVTLAGVSALDASDIAF